MLDHEPKIQSFADFMKKTLKQFEFRKPKPSRLRLFDHYAHEIVGKAFIDSEITAPEAIKYLEDAEINRVTYNGNCLRVRVWELIRPGILIARRLSQGNMQTSQIRWTKYVRLADIVGNISRIRGEIVPMMRIEYIRYLLFAYQNRCISVEDAMDLAEKNKAIKRSVLLEVGHEMTRDVFVERMKPYFGKTGNTIELSRLHERAIRTALDLRKQITLEVLADYPDLGRKVLGDSAPISSNRESVERALKAGMQVPIEVMVRFPDLLAKYGL